MPRAGLSTKSLPVTRFLAAFLCAMALTPFADANPPKHAEPTLPVLQSLSIEPPQIALHGSNRQQQLLITGKTPSGRLIDVTHLCEVASFDPTVARVAKGR